jgi:dihydroorotate dehydrogenase
VRKLAWKAAKSILFRLDAESVHHLALRSIQASPKGAFLRLMTGAPAAKGPFPEAFGIKFRSRLGLAAGFDKNCDILTALPSLGFGFAELGTVTLRPQPGNDRPRLFRDPARGAIFNRMGFNSLGVEIVSRRLREAKDRLPEHFRVGVNLGKNKETSAEDAAREYAAATRPFRGLPDYLVVNVSSPNTPGLRMLQSAEQLRPIVGEVANEIAGWEKKPPLLLKLAPEIEGDALAELLGTVESWGGIDGWVLTNTLAGEWKRTSQTLSGGWSGAPLTERSRRSLERAHRAAKLPIISVGGIMSADEAVERVKLGAALVQVYSGWILEGPSLPGEISRALARIEAGGG